MTSSPGPLIDYAQIHGLFSELDPDSQTRLCEAAVADITEWSERLIAAIETGDLAARQRARHSLRGLCRSFGANSLLELCEENWSTGVAIAQLRTRRIATLAALRQAAGTASPLA